MTTYIQQRDLDSLLEGFVQSYYGTYLDNGDELTIGTQYYNDLEASFNEANEHLQSIAHIKIVPVGTLSSTGNYPQAIRELQGNLMIYARLKSRHYGEFSQGIPGWINTYTNQARQIVADIKGQNLVFDNDVTQGEQGIGVGTFLSKSGYASWYSNWETGIYTRDDFPRTYRFVIDGTSLGNGIGTATFKVSDDNGVSWPAEGLKTDTAWVDVGYGLRIRWESDGGTNRQLELGDTFAVKCVPLNIPVKSGNLRYTTFKRG